MAIEYTASQNQNDPNQWDVNAETSKGQPILAAFAGIGAEQRAAAYALWMNGKYPLPAAPSLSELMITDTKGRKIKLVLSGIEWTSDYKRQTVTARTRANIFIAGGDLEDEVDRLTVLGERQ